MIEITQKEAADRRLAGMPTVETLSLLRSRVKVDDLFEEGALAFGNIRRVFVLTPYSVSGKRLVRCVDADPTTFNDFWQEIL